MSIFRKAVTRILMEDYDYNKEQSTKIFINRLQTVLDKSILPNLRAFKHYPDQQEILRATNYLEQASNYVREAIAELENIRSNTASNEMDNQYNDSFDPDIH